MGLVLYIVRMLYVRGTNIVVDLLELLVDLGFGCRYVVYVALAFLMHAKCPRIIQRKVQCKRLLCVLFSSDEV